MWMVYNLQRTISLVVVLTGKVSGRRSTRPRVGLQNRNYKDKDQGRGAGRNPKWMSPFPEKIGSFLLCWGGGGGKTSENGVLLGEAIC